MDQCIAVSHSDEANVPSRYEPHNHEGYEDSVGQLDPETVHANLIESNIVMNSNRASSSSSQNVQSEYLESSSNELEKKEEPSFSRSQSAIRLSPSYESGGEHKFSEAIGDIREAEGYNEDQCSVLSNKQLSNESFIELPRGAVLTQAGNQGQTSVLHLNSVDSVSAYDDNIGTSDDFVPTTKLREGENLRGRRNSSIMCVNMLSQYQSNSIDETADLNQYFQNESNIDYYQRSKGFENQSTYLNYQIETTTGTSEQFQQQEPQLSMQRLNFHHHEPTSDEVYKQDQYAQKQQHPSTDWAISGESISKFDHQLNEQSYHEHAPQFYNYHHHQQQQQPSHFLPVHSGVPLIDSQHRSPVVNSHPTSDYQVQQESYALAKFHNYDQREDVNATSEKIWLLKRQQQEQAPDPQVNEFEPAQQSQEILTYSEVPETIQYINQTRSITSSFSLQETAPLDYDNNNNNNDNNVNLCSKSYMNRVSLLFEANTSYDHQNQCFSNVTKYDSGGELIEYRPMDPVDPALLLTSECSGGMIIPTQTHTTYGPSLNNSTYHSYETSYQYQHHEISNGSGQYLNEPATYLDLDESGKTYHLMCQSNANLAQNGISSSFEATDSTQNPSCSSNKSESQKSSSLTCYALPEHDGQSSSLENDVPRVSKTYDPNLEISTVLFDNEESTSSHDDEETSWSETPTKYSSIGNKSRSKGTSLSPVKTPRCSQETLQKLRAFLDRRKTIRKANDSSRYSSFSSTSVTSQRLNDSKFSQSQSSNSLCDKALSMGNRLENESSSGIEATAQHFRSSQISSLNGMIENDTSNFESNSSSGDEFKSSSLNSSPLSSVFNGSIDETSNHRSLDKKESSVLIGDGKMKDSFKQKNTDDEPHLINTENRQLRNRTIIIAPKTTQQTSNSDYKQHSRLNDCSLRSKRRRLNRTQDFYLNSSSEPTSGCLR